MTAEEKQLLMNLVDTVKAISDRLDSFQNAVERELHQLKVENNLLRELLERFVKLLEVLEKLIHKIRTAFMESRIWEELEECRENDGRKKHQRESTPGFDVEREPKRPPE